VRRTTVLVVDARPGERARRRAALEAAGLEVCAEVSTARAAVEVADRQEPDICLIDAHVDGAVRAVATIRARTPASRAVIVGASGIGRALEAVAAGAAGYLVGEDSPRLAEVLERVRAGEVAIPRALAARLVDEYRGRSAQGRLAAQLEARGVRLTAKEWQVLQLLADGCQTAEIAQRLGISPVTVRSHASAVVRKLGVPDRAAAGRVFKDAAAA
jgi:DNA-binding NarL/FixJ family response regulator